jgi:hypothetical protein
MKRLVFIVTLVESRLMELEYTTQFGLRVLLIFV